MAKPFYSMEEVTAMLGKTPDQIRKLVRDGSLREFRDAGKIFFKAEDVEQLSGGRAAPPAASDSGEIVLEAADDRSEVPEVVPEPPPSPSGGTSIIGLEPLEDEKSGKKDDTVLTASGIGVFDEDELEIDADPMAKTQITTGPIDDQVSLEGAGSGSGLLDLTRESDDTSLGAELLDEIYPGEEEAEAAPPPKKKAAPAAPVVEEVEPEEEVVAPVAIVEEAPRVAFRVQQLDPQEGIFGGLLVGALILLGVAASVVGGVLQGFVPDYAKLLTDNFWIFLAAACVTVVLALVIGLVVGRMAGPRRA